MTDPVSMDRPNNAATCPFTEQTTEEIVQTLMNMYIGARTANTESPFVFLESLFEEILDLKNIARRDHKNRDKHQVSLYKMITLKAMHFEHHKEACLKENKARYWDLLGKMYYCSEEYLDEAISCLSKAVKLDPSLFFTWNLLGECYWGKCDYEVAKKCFETSLKAKENVFTLRNLSIICRKGAINNPSTTRDDVSEGIALAKRALLLDINDGASWTILGNSYLAAYFANGQDIKFANLALSSYKQAEKTRSAAVCTDLHYNKAVTLKFLDRYSEALHSLERALDIDPSWDVAAQAMETLVKYIRDIRTLTLTKGKLRSKRLYLLMKNIEVSNTVNETGKIRRVLTISELNEGDNVNCVLHGSVVWTLQLDDTFPFTLGLLDKTGNICTVAVYNMCHGKGFLIGDMMSVINPKMSVVDFNWDNSDFSFIKIRVDSPVNQLMVNHKKVPVTYMSPPTLVVSPK